MVVINYSKLCASLGKSNERILCKLNKKCNVKVAFNRSFSHGNCENVKFYLSIKIFHQYIFNLPSFSL